MTAIIFGSNTGNTERAAGEIKKKLGGTPDLIEVKDMSAETIDRYDTLFLGSSTWGYGDLQDDWEKGIETLKKADLKGKKIGFFGCGDQASYSDTFADALGILYEAVKDSGAIFTGPWPTEGYSFDKSKAVVNGKFIGLVLDDDNQETQTPERIAAWVNTLE